jgi:hypothetical protein
MDKGGLPYAILNNQLLKAMTMQTKTAYDDSVRRQRTTTAMINNNIVEMGKTTTWR